MFMAETNKPEAETVFKSTIKCGGELETKHKLAE